MNCTTTPKTVMAGGTSWTGGVPLPLHSTSFFLGRGGGCEGAAVPPRRLVRLGVDGKLTVSLSV